MKRYLNYALNVLPYLFVFIASIYLPRDPDLGWHLKYGEYFFKHHQILRDNIFSSTMTNYHWANGSWGTDILTYTIYIWGGFLGLVITSALIVTLTFYFFTKAAKFSLNEKFIFFPLIAYLETGVNSVSFRGQQISLLLLSILIYLLNRYKYPSKVLWFIPLLFLFWSNIQIESFLGLGVLGLWIVISIFSRYKSIETRERNSLLIILLASFLTTFINPYGWNIHLVALSHIGDPLLQKVNEYIPFDAFTINWWKQIIGTVLLLIASVYLLIKKQFKSHLPLWCITLLLFSLMFFVRRYSWPAFYLLFPFLHIIWQPFKNYKRKISLILCLSVTIITLALTIYINIPFTQYKDISWETWCSKRINPCSSKSAEFLIKHHLTNNVFTFYDWGGWLIWNYPQIKPSVDGRMHLWRDSNGYSSFLAYDEYMSGKKNINTSSYDVVYIPSDRSLSISQDLSNLIKEDKWKVVYKDDTVGIVIRKHN